MLFVGNLTELETKYHTSLEIQHRVDIDKLKKTVTAFDEIISEYRTYVLMGQKQADLLFQRIFDAIDLYRNVTIDDPKTIGETVNKYQEAYYNSSQINDKIVLEILSELDNDIDYLVRFVKVKPERISSPSTKFVLNRAALNIDMYRIMKDVQEDADDYGYDASKPYPQKDKLDSTRENLTDTSSMQEFLQWMSQNASATNQNSPGSNTTNEDTNDLRQLQDILDGVAGSVTDAIYCRSFRRQQLSEASAVISSLFEKQTDFGEFSDTVVFDFEREFQPITEQMDNFQGEFCLVSAFVSVSDRFQNK